MENTQSSLNYLTNLFFQNKTLSIGGPSASGKTTLALQIISNLLVNDCYCLWIQASELFPKKRLQKMFQDSHEKLDHILEHIYLAPLIHKDENTNNNVNHICKDYSEFKEIVLKILQGNIPFLPLVKFIVIDNISHHLRTEILNTNDAVSKINLENEYFNTILFPFLMFCERKSINLILIHEISFNPKLGEEVIFLSKIYKRIDSVSIYLDNNNTNIQVNNKKILRLATENDNFSCKYTLVDNGLKFFT